MPQGTAYKAECYWLWVRVLVSGVMLFGPLSHLWLVQLSSYTCSVWLSRGSCSARESEFPYCFWSTLKDRSIPDSVVAHPVCQKKGFLGQEQPRLGICLPQVTAAATAQPVAPPSLPVSPTCLVEEVRQLCRSCVTLHRRRWHRERKGQMFPLRTPQLCVVWLLCHMCIKH